LFGELSSILKISPYSQVQYGEFSAIEEYCNIFYPCCSVEGSDDVDFVSELDTRKAVSSDNVVFLWGFRSKICRRVKISPYRITSCLLRRFCDQVVGDMLSIDIP
jgi:poly(A)-specific ribonuclease